MQVLEMLESLAKVDETVVREQVVKSLSSVCESLNEAEV